MILLTKDEKVDKTDVLQVADGQPDFLAFTVNGQHEVNLGEVASVRQVPKDMDHREDDALNANKISIVIDVRFNVYETNIIRTFMCCCRYLDMGFSNATSMRIERRAARSVL